MVLKTLVLQTYICKYFEKIRKWVENLYHYPLFLTLVNSVNKPEADLQLFFAELEKIAKEEQNKNIFSQAKEELAKEFEHNPVFYFEENERVNLNIEELMKIEYKDILSSLK